MSAVVTFAQAQERAERWVNADVPGYQRREVRVREFDEGFVAWAEDRVGGPTGDSARARLVIARDSGDATLWPGLPVEEVMRRYAQEYGPAAAPAAPVPTQQRVDLEATSFLLTPPEWLQEAADRMGVPDRRTPGAGTTDVDADGGTDGGAATGGPGAWPDAAGADTSRAGAWDAADTSRSGEGPGQALPATVFAPPLSGSDQDDTPPPGTDGAAATAFLAGRGAPPRTTVAPGLDGPAAPGDVSAAPPGAAPGDDPGTRSDSDSDWAADSGGGVHHAATMLADPSQGTPTTPTPPGTPAAPPPPPAPPNTPAQAAPSAPGVPPPPPAAPPAPGPQRAGKAARGGGPSVPPPPEAPGIPGARPAPSAPGLPASPSDGYVPTQLVSADDIAAQGDGPNGPATPERTDGTSTPDGSDSAAGSGGGVHHAATVLADPSQGAPAAPPPPAVPPNAPAQGGNAPAQATTGDTRDGSAGGGVHHAATMLAGPVQGPPAAAPPYGAGAPGAPLGPPPGPPAPYGYPGPGPGAPGVAPMPPGGVPTVGPGYMAVLRYRASDGSEQQLIRRSAPGTPHPEWQILYELRAMNVPPQQVLELHTELESCDLPGGYCTRMIRETWPQVRVSHTAAYGTDHASRQEGMRHLVEHQGELHQVADAPPRPAPLRAPLPPQHHIQPAPPIPPDGIGHELMEAYGPQGVFRFDQHAVSRQGVPDIVGQVLVWAGVPLDAGPFFWGQAQPGRPVPTLAELARERGVQPGSDASSYLVMGSDFGRQLCVQYGTAHIVAVPLEAGPDGRCGAPQFVSTGLPEFVRCLALLGRMWRLRYGLTPEQAGRWTVDFQMQLAMLDPAALSSPENWWAVLLEQMWDGLF